MVAQVLEVAVDKGFFLIIAQCYYVARIFHGVMQRVLKRKTILEQCLFVVCQHEYQGHVKDILQPLCELQWDRVAEMQAAGAGTAARVQEERVTVFVSRQDAIKVAVAEEETTPQPAVRLVTSDALKALKKGVVDEARAPFSAQRSALFPTVSHSISLSKKVSSYLLIAL